MVIPGVIYTPGNKQQANKIKNLCFNLNIVIQKIYQRIQRDQKYNRLN